VAFVLVGTAEALGTTGAADGIGELAATAGPGAGAADARAADVAVAVLAA
jgi:hypothetical protein